MVEKNDDRGASESGRLVILEGIVTTVNDDGSPNISPMGPIVDDPITRLVLRPYNTSRTYQNLKRRGRGTFHVTDDVLLLAQAAVSRLDVSAAVEGDAENGFVLRDYCRYYRFEVESLDDSEQRTRIDCRVTDQQSKRDFFGFNRAKHAVLEAAILATRIGILPDDEIREGFENWAILVEKTGGDREHAAFDFLARYVEEKLASA